MPIYDDNREAYYRD